MPVEAVHVPLTPLGRLPLAYVSTSPAFRFSIITLAPSIVSPVTVSPGSTATAPAAANDVLPPLAAIAVSFAASAVPDENKTSAKQMIKNAAEKISTVFFICYTPLIHRIT
ncbi:hypothetical protein SDC9_147028 [bioreactor metagenome]|uniref:Uncharacterized protein n=1 Tax=bioreactor metagenome TaxID=1076179 RepID=A0A645EGE5_9ZZZZ